MYWHISIEQRKVGTSVKRTAVVAVKARPADSHHLVVSFAGRNFGSGGSGGGDSTKYHPLKGRENIPLTASDVTSDSITSHEATLAMVGYGFGSVVDPQTGEAHVWTDHVHARKSFETMEMRYRKMIVSGEELVVSNGAVVSGVMAVGSEYLVTASGTASEPIEAEPIVTQDGEYIIWPLPKGASRLSFTVKGEAGIDYQQFIPDDILRYTWRDKETGLKGASGYLVVRAVIDEFTYTADVVEGSPEWLAEGMSLALFGSETNPDRQGFIVLSARERTISIFDGVNSTRITPDNLKVLLGNLSLVRDPNFPEIKGYGLYSQNCFLRGVFVLRSGKTVESEFEQMADETNKEFERVETEFSIIDGKIESKVSKIDYDILGKRVTDAESSISQTAEKIESKVSKTIKDKNGNDLNVETSVIQTAEQLSVNGLLNVNGQIRADKIDTDSLTARQIDTRVINEQGIPCGRGIQITKITQVETLQLSTISAYDKDGNLSSYWRTGEAAVYSDNAILVPPLFSLTYFAGRSTLNYHNVEFTKPTGERAEYGINGITLPPTARIDMPGVLCAGRVDGKYNYHLNKWGAVYARIERISEGKFKIIHNLNHYNYYTQVTPYGLYENRPMLMATVIREELNYVEIWITDRSNEHPLNGNFNYTIFGDGKNI